MKNVIGDFGVPGLCRFGGIRLGCGAIVIRAANLMMCGAVMDNKAMYGQRLDDSFELRALSFETDCT